MTWQTKADAPSPLAGGGALSWLSGLPEWLRSNLFRQSSGARLTWRRVLAGVLFVVAGAAVSLARTSGPGALNTTWIEDAGNFLQDALNQPVLTTLTSPVNGYYEVVPRAVTAVAVAFPVAWAPGIMSAVAAARVRAVRADRLHRQRAAPAQPVAPPARRRRRRASCRSATRR